VPEHLVDCVLQFEGERELTYRRRISAGIDRHRLVLVLAGIGLGAGDVLANVVGGVRVDEFRRRPGHRARWTGKQ
jgi:predicted ATP-dependent serine protease